VRDLPIFQRLEESPAARRQRSAAEWRRTRMPSSADNSDEASALCDTVAFFIVMKGRQPDTEAPRR